MNTKDKAPKPAPLYEVNVTSYIDGVMHSPGAQVRYPGLPGPNLTPLDDAAKAAAKQFADLNAAKYDGDDAGEREAAKNAALRKADDELRGIDAASREPLPERDPELMKHAEQTKKDTAKAAEDDPDMHGLKMTGEQTNTMKSSVSQAPDDKAKPDAAKAK